MRRGAGGRVDKNQKIIVEALEKAGCSVLSLADLGHGMPDVIAGIHGKNFLLEIKNPENGYGRRGLNPNQEKWHRAWRGHVAVVHSATEALAAVGLLAAETGPRGDDLPARGSRGRRSPDRAS